MTNQDEPITPVIPKGLAEAVSEPDNGSMSETLRMIVIAAAIVLFSITLGVLFLLPKLVPNTGLNRT